MPQIDLKIGCAEDRELLILHVHGGEDSPCYYIGDSVLEIFVRIGNVSAVADSTGHKRLVLRGRNSSFDARPRLNKKTKNRPGLAKSRLFLWSEGSEMLDFENVKR